MGSVIGPDVTIAGNIECKGDVEIHGAVEGEIKAKSITLQRGARVSGTIRADALHVSGTLDGQIEASSVELTETAKVTGDLVHDTLSVQPGADVDLRCRQRAVEKKTASGTSSKRSATPDRASG